MFAKLIDLNGNQLDISPTNGETFTLQELYVLLDCDMIEIAYPINPEHSGKIFIVDEEGKLTGKKPNRVATIEYNDTINKGIQDVLVGKVILCDSELLR